MDIEDEYKIIYQYGKIQEHSKWLHEIPYICFPAEWSIQMTPPFRGAVSRFRIKQGNAEVSIYLDCYDRLGFNQEPYWEVYPVDGDCGRCNMNETEELLKLIRQSIEEQN